MLEVVNETFVPPEVGAQCGHEKGWVYLVDGHWSDFDHIQPHHCSTNNCFGNHLVSTEYCVEILLDTHLLDIAITHELF